MFSIALAAAQFDGAARSQAMVDRDSGIACLRPQQTTGFTERNDGNRAHRRAEPGLV